MSPPPAYTTLWKLLESLQHNGSSRRVRRHRQILHRRRQHDDDDDISGAGRKLYGPLNDSAPGWDRSTIEHLMSHDAPHQELAQANVPASDMTKDYVDRYFGFLPPNLLRIIFNHEKSRRRQRIDTYFRAEHGRLPPRISKLLYGTYTPPTYAHKVTAVSPLAATTFSPPAAPVSPAPPAAPATPAAVTSPYQFAATPSPAASSVGSSFEELVRGLLTQDNVQKHESKSAENVVDEMDTFVQVLNNGMRELKDHLSSAASAPVSAAAPAAAPAVQDNTTALPYDDEYLRSLLEEFPDFGDAPPSALAPTPPHASPAVHNRYIAMKKLGAPPSSPPPFGDSDDDSGSTESAQAHLLLSQRISRKSMSNVASTATTPETSRGSSSSSSSRHEQYMQQAPVSEVHRLLRRVFRDHATGQRNTQNATHKILDIAHNIAKEHIH